MLSSPLSTHACICQHEGNKLYKNFDLLSSLSYIFIDKCTSSTECLVSFVINWVAAVSPTKSHSQAPVQPTLATLLQCKKLKKRASLRHLQTESLSGLPRRVLALHPSLLPSTALISMLVLLLSVFRGTEASSWPWSLFFLTVLHEIRCNYN